MKFESDSWDFVGGIGVHSRDMLATVLDQSEDCVKILDPSGRVDDTADPPIAEAA